MIDCRRTAEQLTPYVDDALSPADRAEVEQHLGACPPCRRAALESQACRNALRQSSGALRSEPLPAGLRTRCEALLRAHDRRSEGRWYMRFAPAMAVAVLVIMTAVAVLSVATRRSELVLAQQLVLDHSKCFRLFASAASGGADAGEMEAMLKSRFGWNMHVPPSSPANGITLIGARRCIYAAGTIPHVMYRIGGENVSLFVLDGESRRDAELTTLGHRSRIWSEGATTYVLVSSRSGVDLERAARYVRGQEP